MQGSVGRCARGHGAVPPGSEAKNSSRGAGRSACKGSSVPPGSARASLHPALLSCHHSVVRRRRFGLGSMTSKFQRSLEFFAHSRPGRGRPPAFSLEGSFRADCSLTFSRLSDCGKTRNLSSEIPPAKPHADIPLPQILLPPRSGRRAEVRQTPSPPEREICATHPLQTRAASFSPEENARGRGERPLRRHH